MSKTVTTVETIAEPLLTRQEAAAHLKITTRTFDKYREIGRIPPPAVYLSRRMQRWKLSDIEAVLNDTAPEPALRSA
jgi:predicted DNA-binding transcriptional regulator AlpA